MDSAQKLSKAAENPCKAGVTLEVRGMRLFGNDLQISLISGVGLILLEARGSGKSPCQRKAP